MLLEPDGEALVQLGAGRLGQRVVGGVADQQVAEAEGVLAREAAPCRAGRAPCARARSARATTCSSSGASAWTAPRWNTRPSTSRRSSTLRSADVELVEPGGEQRLDRRRDDDVLARRLADHRHHLLDEQRIALRRLADPLAQALVEVGEALDQVVGLGSGASGSSRTFVAFTFPPAQPAAGRAGPGRAMQSSRIGASRERSATCSTRSRKVSSPQWMSSNTQTSGRLGGDVPRGASGTPRRSLARARRRSSPAAPRSPSRLDRPRRPGAA